MQCFEHDYEADCCLTCGGYLGLTCTNCGDVYLPEYEDDTCTCRVPDSQVMAERQERLQIWREMDSQ